MIWFARRGSLVRGRVLLSCGLALAGLSMAACGASGHPSPAATSPAATPAGATPSPVSTNTALPVAATKAQLDAWAAGPGFTAFKTALSAAGAVATAMSGKNLHKIAGACTRLAMAVAAAQAAPPFPERSAEFDFASALAELNVAASDCQAGAKAGNTGLINTSDGAARAGFSDLVAFESDLRAPAGG
jgi:hypothetical protein